MVTALYSNKSMYFSYELSAFVTIQKIRKQLCFKDNIWWEVANSAGSIKMSTYLHTSWVEGLFSILLMQHGDHITRVQGPPVEKESRVCGSILLTPWNLFGFGIKCVTPWFGLPQEMDHLGISTISETSITVNERMYCRCSVVMVRFTKWSFSE